MLHDSAVGIMPFSTEIKRQKTPFKFILFRSNHVNYAEGCVLHVFTATPTPNRRTQLAHLMHHPFLCRYDVDWPRQEVANIDSSALTL